MKLADDFAKELNLKSLSREFVLSNEGKIAEWFEKREWSPGEKGVWERMELVLALPGAQSEPSVACRLLPLTGAEPDLIPDDQWPFPVRYPLDRITQADGPSFLQAYRGWRKGTSCSPFPSGERRSSCSSSPRESGTR